MPHMPKASTFIDLSKQNALVTGAATGIGEAIAARLARAGASVVIADIDVDRASRTAHTIAEGTGSEALAVRMNVADRDSVNAAVNEIRAQLGEIDILVNNAGLAGRAAPLWDVREEEWFPVIQVNLYGVFHCCRAVISSMRAKKYGRIVNVASIAGKEGNPNMTAYSASKAGVIGFTKSLAKEVATEGICVNAVTPAVIRTELLAQLTDAQVEYMTSRIPMRRTGTTEEVAAVVHFLCSADCSFVTGQCYDVSGGRATY
jgi:2-dehydro-3-deoxy-L-rhamnonate dehydrogenase (NAD+)